MKQLSEFLLILYRESKHFTQIPAFQNWALAGMRNILSFEEASWSYGYFDSKGPQIHGIHHFEEALAGPTRPWIRAKQKQPVLDFGMKDTVLNYVDGMPADKGFTVLTHSSSWDEGRILCTLILEPLTGFCHIVSLYIRDQLDISIEDAFDLKRSLVPHLVEAFNSVQMHRMYCLLRNRNRMLAGAVANQDGVLTASDPAFIMLMRLEWPEWTGPHLPIHIMTESNSSSIIKESNITLQTSWRDGSLFIYARPRLDVDSLSARELSVARRFGQGESYKEIARALRLSPTTVRNHIASIYTKMRISDKTSLTSMLSLSSFVDDEPCREEMLMSDESRRFAS